MNARSFGLAHYSGWLATHTPKHTHTHTNSLSHTQAHTVTQDVSLHTCNLSNRILSRNPFVLTTLLPTCSVMLWPSGSSIRASKTAKKGERGKRGLFAVNALPCFKLNPQPTHGQTVWKRDGIQTTDLSPTFTSNSCLSFPSFFGLCLTCSFPLSLSHSLAVTLTQISHKA